MSRLPRKEDINVYDTLDERGAVRSFLGKTREEIQQLLPGKYESLQEDLAFMGPVAFAYYAPAWEEFCRTRPSDDPEGTEDIVRWPLCIISIRCNGLEDEIPGSIAAMRRMLSWCEGFYNSAEGRTYFTEEARFWGYSEPLLSTPPPSCSKPWKNAQRCADASGKHQLSRRRRKMRRLLYPIFADYQY